MRWSYTLTKIGGTEVRIHTTFLLFLGFIAIMALLAGGFAAAFGSVIFLSALFLCVLLHEFGHAWAAHRCGIRTPDITLLPIGGVARLERLPRSAQQELFIALAGPAVNVVIAGLLIMGMGGLPAFSALRAVENPLVALMAQLAWVNVILVAFNLLPAFPMDGGRVLRALLSLRLPYLRATEIAARCGKIFAVFLGFFGLFNNPILVFTALFVYFGAKQEAAYARMRPAAYDHGPAVEIISPEKASQWFPDRSFGAEVRSRRHQNESNEASPFESSQRPRWRRVVFDVR